jgi:CheY-like chemotaxis protein
MSLPLALILEDDPKLAELYETVLKQCQYETLIIESGREAQATTENALACSYPAGYPPALRLRHGTSETNPGG